MTQRKENAILKHASNGNNFGNGIRSLFVVFALALIPVIGLLVFIYFNDKKEKEPFGLLIGLFFLGMATIVPAIIIETVFGFPFEAIFPSAMIRSAVFAMVIVGPAEELGKFLVLRLMTWKNRHFNYSYDAIVYSVFVSLGFAALENIGYVFSNGIGVAFMRMFTAVPGHACFAVFMGFFYSKAKQAAVTGEKGKSAAMTLLAYFVPSIIHGIYDALLLDGTSEGELVLTGISFIIWIFYVIALFAGSVVLVILSSKHDFCIVTLPADAVIPAAVPNTYQGLNTTYTAPAAVAPMPAAPVQTIYRPSVSGSWTCSCGSTNNLNFCFKCGKQRPFGNIWYCPKCGTISAYNFCGNCGHPSPSVRAGHN